MLAMALPPLDAARGVAPRQAAALPAARVLQAALVLRLPQARAPWVAPGQHRQHLLHPLHLGGWL
jgi:hypothetical protein